MSNNNSVGEVIKRRRVSIPLTLNELSHSSGVSQSHIARIERGERFPSAHVLRRIAKPLGFSEEDLFMIAGFLSSTLGEEDRNTDSPLYGKKLDPSVAQVLAGEGVEVQRAVIGILRLLKVISKSG